MARFLIALLFFSQLSTSPDLAHFPQERSVVNEPREAKKRSHATLGQLTSEERVFFKSGALPVLDGSTPLEQASLWRGHYAEVTGLIYMGARYYDMTSGRFLSPDPLGHGSSMSLYDYANGDPVNQVDPDGRCVGNTFKGAVYGDYAQGTGVGGFVGQVGMGLVPYLGQVADIRDWAAGASDIRSNGWNFGNTAGITLSTAAFIPGAGDFLKGVLKPAVGWAAPYVDNAWNWGTSLFKKAEVPSSRLSTGFMNELQGGGSWLIAEEKYQAYIMGRDIVGRADGQFMTSLLQMNKLINEVGLDPVVLGQKLGVEGWNSNTRLIRMDVLDPLSLNPRLPNSSMSGANSLFIPGGKTINGISEVVTDPIPASQIWATPLK